VLRRDFLSDPPPEEPPCRKKTVVRLLNEEDHRKQLEAYLPRLEAEADIEDEHLLTEEIALQASNLCNQWQTMEAEESAEPSN
jgi:hypothetical protein